MDDKDNCEADVYAAAETEKDEKVDPEKELCHGDDDGLSQLRGEESLTDMEGLPVRETLAKDHVEGNGFILPTSCIPPMSHGGLSMTVITPKPTCNSS